MLTGHPPFTNKERNIVDIKRMIIENKPKFPSYFSKNAIDIIKKFLDNDPSKRLGVRSIMDVKKHSFFDGLNWEDLMQYKLQPPVFTRTNGNLKSDNRKIEEQDEMSTYNNDQYMEGITYMPEQLDR